MANIAAFFGFFFSYLILFLVFVALAVIGCMIGVKWRKAKDAKAALAADGGVQDAAD